MVTVARSRSRSPRPESPTPPPKARPKPKKVYLREVLPAPAPVTGKPPVSVPETPPQVSKTASSAHLEEPPPPVSVPDFTVMQERVDSDDSQYWSVSPERFAEPKAMPTKVIQKAKAMPTKVEPKRMPKRNPKAMPTTAKSKVKPVLPVAENPHEGSPFVEDSEAQLIEDSPHWSVSPDPQSDWYYDETP